MREKHEDDALKRKTSKPLRSSETYDNLTVSVGTSVLGIS